MRVAHLCVRTAYNDGSFYCSDCDMDFVPGFANARGHKWNPTIANYVHYRKQNRGTFFQAEENPF